MVEAPWSPQNRLPSAPEHESLGSCDRLGRIGVLFLRGSQKEAKAPGEGSLIWSAWLKGHGSDQQQLSPLY